MSQNEPDAYELEIPLPDDARQAAHDMLRTHLTKRLGGVTEHVATGTWRDGDGNHVTESVTVYTTVATVGDGKQEVSDRIEAESVARGMAAAVGQITDEDSVMWSVKEVPCHGFH